jgi:hypothetical protein
MNKLQKVGLSVLFLLALIPFLGGCPAKDKSSGSSANAADKPHVEVLLGADNYQRVAPMLVKGQRAKFKGELARAQGNKVIVHVAEVYAGAEPAVKAEDLTKDFITDRAAAEKKYKREQWPQDQIIVEGMVVELIPDHYRLILAGHEG